MNLAHNRYSLSLLTISLSIHSLWPLTHSLFSHCYPRTCFIFIYILRVNNVDTFCFFMAGSEDIVSQVEGRKERRRERKGREKEGKREEEERWEEGKEEEEGRNKPTWINLSIFKLYFYSIILKYSANMNMNEKMVLNILSRREIEVNMFCCVV